MAAERPLEILATYACDGSFSPEYERVQRALNDGYAVVDVIQTAAASPASNLKPIVVTTVLLRDSKNFMYKK